MRSQHAIQKAKRKRQRKHHHDQSTNSTKAENKPFNASILLVHGIGNQKPSELLDKWGESILKEINYLSSQKGWKCDSQIINETTVISLTKNENSYTISLSECIWSNKFKRPERREMASWILGRLPALLLLLLPDSRDFNNLLGNSDIVSNIRLAANFIIRLFLFVGIISWAAWALNSISHNTIGYIALCVLGLVILSLGFTFHSHWNFAGHVKVASDLNSKEASRITEIVRNKIETTRLQSLNANIVAHSQGGLLSHDALAHNSDAETSHLRLFGIGSGIRPITLFRVLKNWPGIMFLWCWSLLALSTFPLLQIIFYTPHVPQLLLVVLRLSALADLSFLTMRKIPTELYLETLSQLPKPRLLDIFNFSSISPALVIVFFISITGIVIASRKLKAHTRHIDDIPNIEWVEITTPHDIVGRFAFPPLPSRVREIIVPSEGNPLFDHTHYFKRGALVPRIIAASTLSDLGILSIDDGISRYESVSKSFLEITRKRWRLVSFISLGATFPFILVMSMLPPNIAILIFTSMLFCFISIPLRFGQYVVNHLRREADIRHATERGKNVFPPSSAVFYFSVIPLLISGGLGLLGGFQWKLLIDAKYLPFSLTPFLFLAVSFIHLIWAAILASNYKPKKVVLFLVSAAPILCLFIIDNEIRSPNILPIGLAHSLLFLASSSLVNWVAPCLTMFRTAKRADSTSGT